ncbi:hypothetical protein GFB81_19130 [Acinetobacter baumannii]|nr:hypothetical protein [Acinetobacter baumannii]
MPLVVDWLPSMMEVKKSLSSLLKSYMIRLMNDTNRPSGGFFIGGDMACKGCGERREWNK